MKPMIDHIHITVEDIERAEWFYDQLCQPDQSLRSCEAFMKGTQK